MRREYAKRPVPRARRSMLVPPSPSIPLLKGLRVLELANVLAGPATGMFCAELGAEVLAIDRDPERCDALKSHEGIHPLCLDATDEKALRAAALEEVEAVVVAVARHLEQRGGRG